VVVGWEKKCPVYARQVFDESLSIRARLREDKRNKTRSMECSGRLKGSRGMSVARGIGLGRFLMPQGMPMATHGIENERED
jgi:hypothetical protein